MGEITQTRPTPERIASYGNRTDGTPKGAGFFGELPRRDDPTSFSGELSAEVTIGGKPLLFPLLVPTLTREEIDHLLSTSKADLHDPGAQKIEAGIYEKAIQHAVGRIQTGKSPFAGEGEFHPLPASQEDNMTKGFHAESERMGGAAWQPMVKP